MERKGKRERTEQPGTIFIEPPPDFSFRATVYSHGWSELAPFSLDEENWRLSYVFTDGQDSVPATVSEDKGRLRVEFAASDIDRRKIEKDIRHILRLDESLDEFYAAVRAHDGLAWIAEHRAGRLVRSPTVWEDLVKTLCTTNCSWGLTKTMVRNIVDKLGGGSFPTPAAMSSADEAFFRNEVKAGYRSPYFVELAEKAASGQLDPESWLSIDLPTSELKKEIKKVKGVGDYAADNLLKLLGRYDGLALDSFLRSQFYKVHNREKPCKDNKIERHYRKLGRWRGLAMWCEMTERWITQLPKG